MQYSLNSDIRTNNDDLVVHQMYRYPIKSLGGQAISESFIERSGILGDRRFAFFDIESGVFCNAKRPRKYGSLLGCTAYFDEEPQRDRPLPPVMVNFPDGGVGQQDVDLERRMSHYLGTPVRLVDTVPRQMTTQIEWDYKSGMAKEGAYADAVQTADGDIVVTLDGERRSGTTFVDLAPLHLLALSSLEHLETLEGPRFDARRFRPSIVIAGEGPGFVDEGWIGGALSKETGALFEVALATPRCVMVTLNHAPDVPFDRTTLGALVRHNTHEVKGFGRGACLGVYADVGVEGTVEVGDVLNFEPGSPAQHTERTGRYRSKRNTSEST